MKKKRLLAALTFVACMGGASAQQHAWGDQGNGTYINPVLNADYSDPDVIRVDDKYYMVASDFNYMGIQMLESADLVNWRLISQVYDHIDGYDTVTRYAHGSWAPALAWHDGRFYVYFCTPEEGLFMTSAIDPRGPWDPLLAVKRIKGWEDPCPFWDDDGQAYLGHSRVGAGPIIIHKMSADGRQLLDDGLTVYTGPVAEGTKFLKHNGWYYLVIPEGGVGTGWQTALRSKHIYGPYEKQVMLEQGVTAINGPHQGNLVSTPAGEWWLLHFQDTPDRGRVVHLEPVRWNEGWPMAGVDNDLNGIGEPVYVYRKPSQPQQPPSLPQHSDEFTTGVLTYKGERRDALGLQWQWNHNPVSTHWSLTERKGWLTLCAQQAEQLKSAPGTLRQKTMGYTGEAVTQIDASALTDGAMAGLCVLGRRYVGIGVSRREGKLQFYCETDGDVAMLGSAAKVVWLKVGIADGLFTFSYSTNGRDYHEAGPAVTIRAANWKGPRLGLYCYNRTAASGKARFNYLHYDVSK